MKKLILIITLTISLAWLCAEPVDKIIARVGTDIIMLSDLSKQINQMKSANMLEEGTSESDILAQMIESRLIIQKARDLDYKVDEKDVKEMAEKQIKQIRKRFDTEEEFVRELRKMKLTQSDLLKYFSDLITEQKLQQEFYRNQIAVKVMVSDREMQNFYNTQKDSLFVKPITWDISMLIRNVEVGEETDKAQYKAIREIQDRLRAGGNFAAIAKEQSECPSSEQGGDLGFVSRGMMVKPFEDAAFKLEVGEISDIVKTQYGYHLIKMDEKRGDQIRVSHILRLLNPSGADTLRTRQVMDSLRAEYLKGTDFASLATAWSMDQDSAKDGGNIGEYGEKDFPELFSTVLTALPTGGITDVLENEGTFYLFTKNKEHPVRAYQFDEVRDKIRDNLTRLKQVQVYNEWIDQLKQEIYVEILL